MKRVLIIIIINQHPSTFGGVYLCESHEGALPHRPQSQAGFLPVNFDVARIVGAFALSQVDVGSPRW